MWNDLILPYFSGNNVSYTDKMTFQYMIQVNYGKPEPAYIQFVLLFKLKKYNFSSLIMLYTFYSFGFHLRKENYITD